ncbi:MAG TPA: phosphotransferase [Polyangia bacterium]|nr:phosphotransferase [Polyangia bacterium]
MRHVEPALFMRRLDPGGFREKVARDPSSAIKLAGDFGAVLAAFHGRSPIVRTGTPVAEREAEHLSIANRSLERHSRSLALRHAPRRMLGGVARRAERWLEASRPLLSARAQVGCRVDGHGDLHVDNLHFLNGKVTLLDVQPHRRYRINDVASDLGRLAFEVHRLCGERARSHAVHAYEHRSATVPAPLVSYFEAKSLLVDLSVLAKYRAQRRPEPQRAAELLEDVSSLCARILALPQR